jgi:hypothetical protein
MFDSPFLYLSACSIRNRVLGRVRRLRQPRYLVGAVVGAAYLYLVFFRRMHLRRNIRGRTLGIPPDLLAPLQLAGAFVLWLVVLARWIVPVSIQPLKLSGAERDLLLTAPVARRRITRYKLLRSQLGVFLSTAFMLIVAWSSVGSAWSFLLGMFLLFTALRLHLLGVALTRGMLRQGGRRDPATIAALTVLALCTAGAIWALAPGIVAFAGTRDLAAALPVVRDAASRPPVAIALLPFTLVVRPVVAGWPLGFLAAAWPVVGLVLLNYAWVVRAQDQAEQSAVTSEQETVEGRRAPSRAVYRRAPFALAPHGRPEWAVAWKNLIMLGRYASPAMLLRVAAPLAVISVAVGTSHSSQLARAAVPLAIALSCGLTLLGPYSFRNDLRQDLLQLSVLKTWPISGERLLWGEVLAPWLVVTAVVWVCIVITGGLTLAVPATTLGWTERLALGSSALILFPAVILAQIIVQNAAVVLFPGWVAVGPSRPRGVEAMGQQMLMFGGSMLLLALGILPGAAFGAIVAFLGYRLIGWLGLVPGAAMVAGLLAVEIVVAVHLLGGVIDRTDPSAIDPAP